MNSGLILLIIICCGMLPIIISLNEKKKKIGDINHNLKNPLTISSSEGIGAYYLRNSC